MKNLETTIVAPVTSLSGGSIGLIRASGENCISLINNYFPAHNLQKSAGGRFYYGKLCNEKTEAIDEVLVYVFTKPNSYTGENVIEISCHNNIFIIDEIIDIFLKNGCRLAEPGEFSKRAFLNGKIDLAQAEAVADLIDAKSKSSTKNSLQMLQGKLSMQLAAIKKEIIDLASLLELDLDFSEEDLEVIPKEKYISVVEKTIAQIESLISSFKRNRHFGKGIEVLIAGKPNVGKSSLMNSLLEKDRVIVSHIPGTTRDLIHEDIILEDSLVRLIDTAGIRFTEDQVEAEGVSRAKKLLSSCEIVLIVLDISEKLDSDDIEIINNLLEIKNQKLIIVGNKIDKIANIETTEYIENLRLQKVFISAKKETNINQLRHVICDQIKPVRSANKEEIIITNKRHYQILSEVKVLLEQSLLSFINKQGTEFIAVDLRMVLEKLSEITGEITSDDILNNIFSSFCIGK